jgi:hypothetical protein
LRESFAIQCVDVAPPLNLSCTLNASNVPAGTVTDSLPATVSSTVRTCCV